MGSFGEEVAKVILKEHGEKHREKTGHGEEVGAVVPTALLFAEVVVAAVEEGSGAKKLPRPEPRRKLAVGGGFQVVGSGEDHEGERRAEDDGAFVWGTPAKPERKDEGDDYPSGALQVVEGLVGGGKEGHR